MAFARKLHPNGTRGSVRVWFYSVDRLSSLQGFWNFVDRNLGEIHEKQPGDNM